MLWIYPVYPLYPVYPIYPCPPACAGKSRRGVAAELLERPVELCNQYCMKAVLLLLLAVGTAAAPHVNFLQFSQNGKPSGVRSAIGYPIEVLEFAWRKYGSRLIRAVHRYPGFTVVARSRDRLKLGKRVAESLYNGLYWIHHYPTIAGAAWPTKRRYTRKMFYDCVMPVVLHLSQLVDEIHYSDRPRQLQWWWQQQQ